MTVKVEVACRIDIEDLYIDCDRRRSSRQAFLVVYLAVSVTDIDPRTSTWTGLSLSACKVASSILRSKPSKTKLSINHSDRHPMDSRGSPEISISNISPDVLHRIVETSLPMSLPDPISSRAAAIEFFSSTPPYNSALTCRAWRDVVLSSYSLWSSLFLSFDLPDREDCDVLRRKIRRHLQRAGNAPLTIFLQLSSRYSGYYIRFDDIVHLIYTYRSTWKRTALDMDTSIISSMVLDLADLKFLEELYIGSSIKLKIFESIIPSRVSSWIVF
ncbi:hypothetical protein SCHPADRAFT_946620 [Schizopora paradoxa]|uniref:F-box domain-containing protein n=1 Tax=Schizopora paradoxa TaxID=27342 RepID=A0A0H2R1X8_9AGAM|nr:hypothetical protein SCHPADRAFT_946620 [Schizopora paradoxa]